MADKKNKKEGKKNTGFALACWICIALLLFILFLVKKDTILSNLKSTDFFGRIFGKTPEFVTQHQDITPVPVNNDDSDVIQVDVKPDISSDQDQNPKQSQEPITPSETETKDSNVQKQNGEKKDIPIVTPSDASSKAKKSEPVNPKADTEKPTAEKPTFLIQLCFVIIDSDGTVSRQIITRRIPKSDAPLTDAVKALLSGPTQDEKAKNCMTLIPPGTKLLGATVKNGIATLNFSEEFEYNKVGVEGYIAQLMQVVYTATSFNTVNSVQFIVEGQREDYLGSEGEWIGSPLSRSSFR